MSLFFTLFYRFVFFFELFFCCKLRAVLKFKFSKLGRVSDPDPTSHDKPNPWFFQDRTRIRIHDFFQDRIRNQTPLSWKFCIFMMIFKRNCRLFHFLTVLSYNFFRALSVLFFCAGIRGLKTDHVQRKPDPDSGKKIPDPDPKPWLEDEHIERE